MKVLKTDSFISERVKVKPVTNAEWDKVKKYIETKNNPFGITEKDLVHELKGFPMGVVVRMLEEQEKQGFAPNVEIFQQDKAADERYRGFKWYKTDAGQDFWTDVIGHCAFYVFFKKYPDYKKYNSLKTVTPNKYDITEKDLTGKIKDFPISVVVRMLEEIEAQGKAPDVKILQKRAAAYIIEGGFDWTKTPDGNKNWNDIILCKNFDKFYKLHPEYRKYDIY